MNKELDTIWMTEEQLNWKDQKDLANDIVESDFFNNFDGKEKQWEQFKALVYRWVNNNSLIAKTIWIHRDTIAAWKKKLQIYHKELAKDLDPESEFMKMMEQLDWMYQKIWHEIVSSNLTEMKKIDAITKSLAPLKMKWEMMWFFKWEQSFMNTATRPVKYEFSQNVYNYYSDMIEWNLKDGKKTMAELIWVKRI